jgi:sepiapterin reductase
MSAIKFHSSLRPLRTFDINFVMEDPVIIITGAGKGIGQAIVEELFARSNGEKAYKPRLFLVSRTQKELKTLQDKGREQGLKVEILEADIGDSKSAQTIPAQCISAFGRIDCLINNAGVGRFGEFTELTEEDLDYVFQINLKGTFLLTQSVFKQMTKQKSGHMIFVTSVAARKPFEQSSIYCMSKYGQMGLVEVLRLYGYKAGIRITNVLPGATYTPMWGEQDKATIQKMVSPESVAQSVVSAMRLPAPANLEEIVIRPMTGDI